QNPISSQIVYQHKIDGEDGLLAKSGCSSRNSCFVYFEVHSSGKSELKSSNILLLSEFKSAVGLVKPHLTVNVDGPFVTANHYFTFNIALETDHIAPFVWLEVANIP
ncbi:Beta-mannosidase, partial [Stegodyphus mimosarum]